MINHTSKILSSEIINILFAEESRIKTTEGVSGSLKVDRVFENELELIFDGYSGMRLFRLIGKYNLVNKIFTWE